MFKLSSLDSDEVRDTLLFIEGGNKATEISLTAKFAVQMFEVCKGFDWKSNQEERVLVGRVVTDNICPLLLDLVELEGKKDKCPIVWELFHICEDDLSDIFSNLYSMGFIGKDLHDLLERYLCKHEDIFVNVYDYIITKYSFTKRIKNTLEENSERFI